MTTFIATTFTQIRDDRIAPDAWASSKIVIRKKDIKLTDDDEPSHFKMISLTINIGKLYHTIEASRALQFMLSNNYLDPTAQKAYVDGVNGCVEHIPVVQEVIQHAKIKKKTANITWFDLKDAFRSVPFALIPHAFSDYHKLKSVVTYIASLYSKLEGTIFTKE